MKTLEIILGIVIMVIAAALTAAVLAQSGKEKKSGVIMGSSDTFIGKDRTGKWDKLLARVTTILSIVFVAVVVVMYVVAAK